ncbi:MAG: hypothetical protein IJH55_02890 [Romboutsia sp.]|nr:hypothetical protein [Romboutsia sp.]
MSNYITEAFKRLNLLEDMEDEVMEVGLDASGIGELRSFLDDAAVDPDEEMDVFDLEAEAKEDLKKSYEGKVILECLVCHSNIFEDPINISMDEEGLACQNIECPYCMSNEGYYIIGEVAPYDPDKAEEFSSEEELDEVDIEGAADDIDTEDIIEEGLSGALAGGAIGAAVGHPFIGAAVGNSVQDTVKDITNEGFIGDINIGNGNSLNTNTNANANASVTANDNDIDIPFYLGKKGKKEPVSEDMKLDGIEELYDNDELRGVEELKGSEKMEGSGEIRGDKYREFLGESKKKNLKESKTPWIVSSDVDGEIARVKSEDEAKATIDQMKREDRKTRKDKKIEYFYSLDEGILDGIASGMAGGVGLVTSIADGIKKGITEDIEDVSVTTEDEMMTMTTKEDGGIVIETSPKEELETEVESEEEMVAPISDETSEMIDASIDALDDTDEEEFDVLKDESEEELEEEPEEFGEFEEFDEESFDNLGESYLKSCYENVNSFKTSGISCKGNKLFIEGIIGFDSGTKKKTNFVFEAVQAVNGNYKFEGYNKEISRGKKTFKLSGSLNNNKLTCESLNYNYRSKNELNESIRVYGTVRKK